MYNVENGMRSIYDDGVVGTIMELLRLVGEDRREGELDKLKNYDDM